MKADLSRTTFHRQHHFSRVLMQQGRVLLDADWNEQVAILLHQTRSLAADLIGPHGGPGGGYEILCEPDFKCDFGIGWGNYYVDGVLCENQPPVACPPPETPQILTYMTQPDFPIDPEGDDPAMLQAGKRYLVYLDVWERHLNALQADHIREVALGGPDTATRAQVICQVKTIEPEKDLPDDATCAEILDATVVAPTQAHRCLAARARVETPSDDPCIIPPQAQYRGPENQLYRVEIHDSGQAAGKDGATFKWSRDNGSVVFGVLSLQGQIAELASLGPDAERGLKEGDWVEIVDDVSELRTAPRPLRAVAEVDRVGATVTLDVPEGADMPSWTGDAMTHPLLRRWDQGSDAIPITEGTWIELEDGVQIWFEPGGTYQAGDHWLIPARVATGDVLWPTEPGPDGKATAKKMPPQGIVHRYAPLALITMDDAERPRCDEDCRCVFQPLCAAPTVSPPPPGDDRPGTVTPQRERLETLVFEQSVEAFLDEARELLPQNVERIMAAMAADTATRVELISIGVTNEEGDRTALELAEIRAKRVVEAYREMGVPEAVISDVSARVEDDGDPRVETDVISMVRRPQLDNVVREPVSPVILERIDGVGSAFSKRLIAAGMTEITAVAEAEPQELVKILTPPGGREVALARVVEIIENAKKVLDQG